MINKDEIVKPNLFSTSTNGNMFIRKLRKGSALVVIAFTSMLGANGFAQVTNNTKIYEAYPDKVQTRLKERLSALRQIAPNGIGKFRIEALVNPLSRWTSTGTKYVITVAFKGGDNVLDGDIAREASKWTNYGNVTFDFGHDPVKGTFRQWSPSDTRYTAQIRVSFDQQGYWSYIGNQSVDPSLAGPGEASLNLQGFDTQRPVQWTNLVLHEFGHALGFEHEHQNPAGGCETEFRWDSDLGYVDTQDQYGQFITDITGKRPGIYKFLGGPLNNWSREMVDQNLRQIPNSRATPVGPFDKKSIMEYHFDAWMYVSGTNSSCYSEENLDLSSGDKAGIAYLFPLEQNVMISSLKDQQDLTMKILDLSRSSVRAQDGLQQYLMQMQK